MMLRFSILVYLMACILISCKQQSTTQSKEVVIPVFSEKNLPIDFKAINVVTIETEPTRLLGYRLIIKCFDDEIYIADQENHQCVFRYDGKGNFLSKIGSPGKGPDEYLSLVDFTVHGDTVEILSHQESKAVIIAYDKQGNHQYNLTIDQNASAFLKLGKHYLLSPGYNTFSNEYRLVIADEKGNITSQLLSNNTALRMSIEGTKFIEHGNSAYLKETFDNIVYEITTDTFKHAYVLDFGPYSIPDDFYTNEDFFASFEKLNEKGFAVIGNLGMNQHYVSFGIQVQKMENIFGATVLYDKKNNKIYSRSTKPSTEESILMLPVGLSKNNELIYLLQASAVIANLDQLKQMPISNPQSLASIQESDNPVLFYCSFE